MKYPLARAAFVTLLLAVLAAPGPGATRTWDAGGDKVDWFDAANWAPDGDPKPGDELTVEDGSPETSSDVFVSDGGSITLTGPSTSALLTGHFIVGDSGTASLGVLDRAYLSTSYYSYLGNTAGARGYALVSNTLWDAGTLVDRHLSVGRLGGGELEITDGGIVTSYRGFIGEFGGSDGVATIAGNGSRWTCTDSLFVGGSNTSAGGAGELTVDGGGSSIVAVDVTNTLKVWGSGTVDLASAEVVADEIELLAGATLTMASDSALRVNALTGFGDTIALGGGLRLGHTGGSGSGSHAVGAAQSLSTAGGLMVGYNAAGELTVSDGGTVESLYANVGLQGTGVGTATVEGAGSSWTMDSMCLVGNAGKGTLTIRDEGHVSAELLRMGLTSAASGTVTVEDAGSLLSVATDLEVGGLTGGTGELNLDTEDPSELAVQVGGTLTVSSTGTINATGGELLADEIELLAGATFNTAAKSRVHVNTLTGFGDTVSFDGYLAIGHAGGSGVGSHTVASGQSLDAKSLYVGTNSTGTLTVVGGGHVTAALTVAAGYYSGGDGTITVDGSGSLLAASTVLVGLGSDGALEVTNGGQVECTQAMVSVSSSSTGVATISGDGSQWTCTDSFYVGGNSTDERGPGELIINGGGSSVTALDVGDTLKVWGTGTVDVTSAEIVANEIELLAGATFTMDSDSTLRVNTLTGFGDAVSLGGALRLGHTGGSSHGSHTVGAGQSLSTPACLIVGYDAFGELVVTGGGTVSSLYANVGLEDDGVGYALVDGAGSSWTMETICLVGNQGMGTLIARNGGQVSAEQLRIGVNSTADGTVTVEDVGSLLSVETDMRVGGSTGGVGELNVLSGGAVEISRDLELWWDGTVNLAGGTIHCGDVVYLGGTIDFQWGRIEIDADMTLGGGAPATELVGDPGVVGDMKALAVGGTVTLLAPLTLDGGEFSVGAMVDPGFFEFVSGTFALTGDDLVIAPGGMFGRTVTLTSAQTLDVTNTATVTPAGVLDVQGGAFSADELVNSGQVILGGLPSLIGGTTLTNHGFIRGDGTITSSLHNQATGQVLASAGQRLALAGAGNTNAGALIVDGGTLEISQDLTNTGQVSVTDGALRVSGPVTNAAAGTISGSGRVSLRFGSLDNSGLVGVNFAEADVYGDITNGPAGIVSVAGESQAAFVGDLANSGDVYVGPGSTAVFLGHVSGPGDFPGGGLVEFVDGFSPGASAAIIDFGGDVTFGPAARLNIELADPNNADPLSPRYDALAVAGDVALAGTLSLDWLAVPGDPGSKFGGEYSILAYGGSRNGTTFDAVAGEIVAYLDESVFPDGIEYDDAAGEVKLHLLDLLDGDADLDGLVGRDDLLDLRTGHDTGGTGWALGDFDFDGVVDSDDYLIWKANVGSHVPGAVPEPATLVVLALGGVALTARRSRRRATS